MKALPKTRLGKWSCGLILAFAILFLFTTIVIVGLFKQQGGNTIFDNLFISVPMISAITCAIAAFVTGVISVWKYKERSLVVFVPITIGLLIALFVLGEVTTPH